MKFIPLKWRLMLTTLPMTAAIVLVKFFLISSVNFDGIVKYSEVSLVVTGGIFLLGFMLAGVMADYKESEKLPSELACTLETLEDTITLCYTSKGGFELRSAKAILLRVTESVLGWLKGKETFDQVLTEIHRITDVALMSERAGSGSIGARLSSEQHHLRKVISRMNVIKSTGFLATGYAFLETLTVVIIGLLMVAKFENLLISMIIVSFVTTIFLYMIRLIRDVDQPFEYAEDHVVGAADIDLFPLEGYYRRAVRNLETTEPENPLRVA